MKKATLKERFTLGLARLIFWAAELPRRRRGPRGPQPVGSSPEGRLFSFDAKTNDGRSQSFSAYRGSVMLIVNTASRCGFTPQYEELEDLNLRYGKHGLKILAFPCDDFGGQEPGSDEEIRSFCRSRYDTTFELFSKIHVKGPDAHPLYRFLTEKSAFPGPIPWNFTKFLVDHRGKVVARFGPSASPIGRTITDPIDELLATRDKGLA